MLKPVEMRELRIVTLDRHVDDIVKKIEVMGNVHLIDIKEVLEEWEDLVEPFKADTLAMKCSDLLTRMDNLIALLRPMEAKKGIKEMLFKEPDEVERVKVGARGLEELEKDFEDIEKVVIKLVSARDRLRGELSTAKEISEVLKVLEEFGIDLDFLDKKEFISVYAGKLPLVNVEGLRRSIESLTGKNHFIVSKEIAVEEETSFSFAVIVTLKKNEEGVQKELRMANFEAWQRPAAMLIPEKTKEAVEELEARIKRSESELKEKEEKIEEIRGEEFDDLLVMRELVQIEESKAKAKVLFGKTESVRVIEGWTPREEVNKVVEGILEEVGEFCVIEVKEPKREDVGVPSLLKNPKIAKPFESIIKMFGPPLYKDIDPTIITAIIFPILFGFMFPDIGHGLLVVLLGLALMFVFKGLGKGLREMGIIIVLCGFCSVIGGALFGEFFGFSEFASHLVEDSLAMSIPHWLIFKPLWFEPIPEAEFMFVLTMLIGAMHMGLGLFLNGMNNFSNRHILEGITNFVRIWCLFGALYFLLLLFGFFFMELKEGNIQVLLRNATVFIVLPIILLFLFRIVTELRHGGNEEHSGHTHDDADADERKERRSIMDLLIIFIDGIIDALMENFFRFLANTVSYGRILALALCHAALMEVFILLSFMCLKINVGVAAIVFLAGTALVVILEALIAGIHTIRLHFYEWFTKFYDGGGVEFSPFKFSRTYTE
jgi:V/A-type H+-transporting ATPase subunit I